MIRLGVTSTSTLAVRAACVIIANTLGKRSSTSHGAGTSSSSGEQVGVSRGDARCRKAPSPPSRVCLLPSEHPRALLFGGGGRCNQPLPQPPCFGRATVGSEASVLKEKKVQPLFLCLLNVILLTPRWLHLECKPQFLLWGFIKVKNSTRDNKILWFMGIASYGGLHTYH